MAVDEKRIYELTDEQTTIVDTDLGVLDKSGNTSAKKFTMLNLYNYIASKLSMVTTFIGLSDVPATYAGQSGKYVSVNVSEDGLEFTTITFPEENVLFYANSGLFPVTGAVDNLYIAKNSGAIAIWSGASYFILNPTATGENIATDNLVFIANSTTDFAGFKATFDNAELKIISNANGSSDIPFQVTKDDEITPIITIQGDEKIYLGGANLYSHLQKGGAQALAITAANAGNTASSVFNFGYNAGELYISGTGDGNGSFIHRFSTTTDAFDTYQTSATSAYYQVGRFTDDFKIKSTVGVGFTLQDSITVKQATGDVVIGHTAALATNATGGFLQIPSCAGVPTGVPTVETGKIPICADATNNKLYIYSGGAWVALN